MSFNIEFEDVFCDNFHLDLDNVCDIPTQQLLFKRDNDHIRHADPISEEQFKTRIAARVPSKTRKATSWSLSVYQDWAKSRNSQVETLLSGMSVPLEPLSASDKDLDFWFSRFVMEVRRQDRSDYPPNTLSQIMAGIQRYMRDNGRVINLFKKDDPMYLTFRKSLDTRMKELTVAGIGVSKKRADPITEQDEDTLWNALFSNITAKSLSYAVFFYNCKLFGLRGMDEHRDLKVDQFAIGNDCVGKYVSFAGRITKNNQGGLDNKNIEPKFIKHYGDPTNPRCVVEVYQKYIGIIGTGPFYLRPLAPRSLDEPPKFSAQAIGINTLSQYMKRMFDEAGIDTTGRNISNHSGKVTCCTTLFNAGFNEKSVKGRSGHRSSAVQLYERESGQMLKDISNTLQPPKPETCTVKEEPENKDPVPQTNVLKIIVPESISVLEIEKGGKKIKLEI